MKYTTESWIKKAKEIHGDVYDYSLVKYVNQRRKVKILCRKCGRLFEQSAGNHLSGHGCSHCKKERLRNLYQDSLQDFIDKAVSVHGYKYDYSLVDYKGSHKKVEIICRNCGKSFKQKPCNHTNLGAGCPHCRTHGFKGYKGGSLYILLDDLRKPSFMKIGVAHKISRRLTELRNATPFGFYLAMHLRMAGYACLEVESSLHEMFKDLNLNLKGFNGATEWFDFSEDVFDNVLDLAKGRYTFLKRRC